MPGKDLGSILQDLYDKLDYNPQLATYKNSLVRRVNDKYRELCTDHQWLFLQRTITLQLRAQVAGSTGITAEIPAANLRRVIGTGTSWRADMAGQTLTIGANSAEYTIQSVDTSNQYLYLTRAAPGAVAATTTWTIGYPQYLLPADFLALIALQARDNLGPLTFISRTTERAHDLEGIGSGTGTSFVAYLIDTIHDTGPTLAPALALQSGGNLDAATEYAYAYAWIREGREGPMSPETRETTDVANKTIRVTPASSLWRNPSGGGSPSLESGIYRALYRRDVTNDGGWIRITTLTDGTDTYYDDNALLPEYAPNLLEVDGPEWSGPCEQIRFWYTASADREIELVYHYQPPELVADTDRPHLPRSCESMLVDMVMEELTQKVGDTASARHYGQRVANNLSKMVARHIRRGAPPTQAGWKATHLHRGGRFSNFTTPTKLD